MRDYILWATFSSFIDTYHLIMYFDSKPWENFRKRFLKFSYLLINRLTKGLSRDQAGFDTFPPGVHLYFVLFRYQVFKVSFKYYSFPFRIKEFVYLKKSVSCTKKQEVCIHILLWNIHAFFKKDLWYMIDSYTLKYLYSEQHRFSDKVSSIESCLV